MHRTTLSMVIALIPAALGAQVSARAESQTEAGARVGKSNAQVTSSTTVEAELELARRRGVPSEPIERRVAEGRAKGASEAELALAAANVRSNLEAAHEAMIRAGREEPSDEEVEYGAWAIERGYTSAQIEAVVESAPAERSLVVAFDVLSRLAARGVASANAVAQVQSKLTSRASDAQIDALATTKVNGVLGASSGGQGAQGAAAVSGNAAVGAAASGAAGAGKVAGSVTGAVGGVIKP